MSDSVKFRMVMTRGALEEEQRKGQAGEVTFGDVEPVEPTEPLTEARFLELVAVIVTGTIATFALRLANRWLRSKDRGTLVDLSKNPMEISLVQNIPYGTIILVGKDGKSSVHKTDAQDVDQLQGFILNVLQQAAQA